MVTIRVYKNKGTKFDDYKEGSPEHAVVTQELKEQIIKWREVNGESNSPMVIGLTDKLLKSLMKNS